MHTSRIVEFTIPVAPQSVQHGSRYGRGHFYSDKKKRGYIASIIEEVSHHAPNEPWPGPVAVEMSFYLPRPKWVSDRESEMCAWQIRGVDDDNIYKGTKDALTKAGFWIDDSQVCRSTLKMMWSEDSLFPRIEVKIAMLNPPDGNIPPAIRRLLKERQCGGETGRPKGQQGLLPSIS